MPTAKTPKTTATKTTAKTTKTPKATKANAETLASVNLNVNGIGGAAEASRPEFVVQQIFVKDISFETPSRIELQNKAWQPNIDVDLNASTIKLAADVYQVQLSLTATAKVDDKVAFLIEVHQVGIFTVKGFTDPQLHRMLGSYCPNILFPYAREVISNIVSRGGFPPLFLAPINFDVLYDQQQQKQAAEKTATKATAGAK